MGHDERSTWDLARWREYARERDAAYLDAMKGWGGTMRELEQQASLVQSLLAEIKEQRRLLATFSDAVTLLSSELESRASKGVQKPRPRPGRPPKTAEDTKVLAEAVENIRAEYTAAHPGAEVGDNVVLTWHFERMFQQRGIRGSRARTREFQAKLKTLRNRLGDYRNKLYRRNPEN